MDVLNMIAYQKGVNYESVANTIVACGGPVNKGTKVRRTFPHNIMAILDTTKASLCRRCRTCDLTASQKDGIAEDPISALLTEWLTDIVHSRIACRVTADACLPIDR